MNKNTRRKFRKHWKKNHFYVELTIVILAATIYLGGLVRLVIKTIVE